MSIKMTMVGSAFAATPAASLSPQQKQDLFAWSHLLLSPSISISLQRTSTNQKTGCDDDDDDDDDDGHEVMIVMNWPPLATHAVIIPRIILHPCILYLFWRSQVWRWLSLRNL